MYRIGRPNLTDAPPWYAYFFALAEGDDLLHVLQDNKQEVVDLITSIPSSSENYRYAEGKWTIKQVFIHLIEEERYYSYKAFCYSRDVDVYLEIPPAKDHFANNANAVNRTLEDIAEEFTAVRDSSITLFKHMTNDMLDFKDFPGATIPYSARSLGWMIAGHSTHHCNLVRVRYMHEIS